MMREGLTRYRSVNSTFEKMRPRMQELSAACSVLTWFISCSRMSVRNTSVVLVAGSSQACAYRSCNTTSGVNRFPSILEEICDHIEPIGVMGRSAIRPSVESPGQTHTPNANQQHEIRVPLTLMSHRKINSINQFLVICAETASCSVCSAYSSLQIHTVSCLPYSASQVSLSHSLLSLSLRRKVTHFPLPPSQWPTSSRT